MIKTITCIIAVCDICGAPPPGLNDGETHFELGREADALNEAEGAEWWTEPTTNLVLCDTRDEAHIAKARQILGAVHGDERETFLTYWPELAAESAPACTAEVSDHTCTCLTGATDGASR